MFEGISLCKIQYSTLHMANSLVGVNVSDEILSTALSIASNGVFLKDCSYLLDGISRVCPSYPISDFAKENLFYVQSFSFWESGKSYFTRRQNLASYLIVYTYSGVGKLEYNGKTFTLKEGDIFLIDCREPHYYKSDDSEWTHCDLHFDGKIVRHLYDNFKEGDGFCFHLQTTADYQTKLEALLREYVSVSPYREYQISAHLNSLLAYLLTETQNYAKMQQAIPDQLRYLIYYINNNYTKELSLEFLADFFGFSKYHLCRIFKKYTGHTINHYITLLRIDRAKELLTTTSLPANKICVMVGIEDTNYFYRLFKKYTGSSPNEYR